MSDNNLIVIEGIDGAGKTTVSEHIKDQYGCVGMTQPEDSWVGEAARRALKDDVHPSCDLFLHMAAHANQQNKIHSSLQNKDVVMDRYYHSRVAYQSIECDFSPEEIYNFHSGWTIEPTLCIILDLPAEESLRRKQDSSDKFEKVDFLSEVRSVYKSYFADQDNVHIVDADRPKQEVLENIIQLLPELSE